MSHLLTFPNDDNEIGSWLESLLISPDFSTTVSQLSALGVDNLQGEATPIDSEAFYQSAATGLSHLSVEQCRWLLRNRDQLQRLNEKIFEFRSQYWMGKREASPSDDGLFNRVAESNSGQRQSAAKPTSEKIKFQSNRRNSASESRRLRSNLRQLLTMAVGLLFCFLGLAAYQMMAGGQAESWGWQTHEFEQTVTREQYFNSLDQSLTQWHDQSKETGGQLASRLDQLSQGCDRLINTAHEPLSKSDKDWLLGKCDSWKKTIDKLALVAKASSDHQAVEKVKSNADDLVSKISLAIKDRILKSAG